MLFLLILLVHFMLYDWTASPFRTPLKECNLFCETDNIPIGRGGNELGGDEFPPSKKLFHRALGPRQMPSFISNRITYVQCLYP